MPRTRKTANPCDLTRQAVALLGLVLAASLLGTIPTSRGQSPLTAEKKALAPALEPFCILPESYEMKPEIFVLAPGAHRVGFTLARQTESGLELYSRREVRDLGLTWYQCFLKGQEAATRHLQTMTPEFNRDSQKIIQYAHFHSDNPLTASIFISPEFRKGFYDSLGKEVYVAIPDRFNVFVFPRLSDSIEKTAPKMAILHKEALYPVSREVFELSSEGIRVVGKF